MAVRIGENIQREWQEDSRAPELWDALEALTQDREAGISFLTNLAEEGSALAMMYLGHAFVSGDDSAQVSLGEEWLTRSAAAGSIEGRYQLALHHWGQQNWDQTLRELNVLSEKGYAPAMYHLGRIHYGGVAGAKDVPTAVMHLSKAKEAGHLPAMGLLSLIYRKEGYGLAGRVASHWNCLAKIPAAAWYLIRYPSSDRLRGVRLPSARSE